MTSGIYKIQNNNNGKLYVGSAVNIDRRFQNHLYMLRRNKHHSRYLQNAWNKYGENAFIFAIVEECDKSKLLEREQLYIDKYHALDMLYNTSLSAYRITRSVGERLHSRFRTFKRHSSFNKAKDTWNNLENHKSERMYLFNGELRKDPCEITDENIGLVFDYVTDIYDLDRYYLDLPRNSLGKFMGDYFDDDTLSE